MNEYIFTGNVGSVRLNEERKIINFSVAVNDWSRRDEDGTLWVNAAVFSDSDARFGFLRDKIQKGVQVMVHGSLREARAYTTRDGEVRASLEVRARNIEFPQGSGNGSNSGGSGQSTRKSSNDSMNAEDLFGADEDDFIL